MKASRGGLNRIVTDIARDSESQWLEGSIFNHARTDQDSGRLRCRLIVNRAKRWGVALIGFVEQRQQRMGTAFALVDASIAEAPIAFIAKITSPIAFICPS
jgi:hypothetical protein